MYAITTCPYTGTFYSVALSLFPRLYLKASTSPTCLQWPIWKGIKRLCHCHACRLNFIDIKLLYVGSWLCSDTTSHHWQIQVRRHEVVCWWALPASRQCGVQGHLKDWYERGSGIRGWEIHPEVCRREVLPFQNHLVSLLGCLLWYLLLSVFQLGLYCKFYFLRMLKP